MCTMRWGASIVNFGQQTIRACCRTPLVPVTQQNLDELGTDAFLNHPYLKARRLEMLEGARSRDCEFCWKLEDKGAQSVRQSFSGAAELESLSFRQGAPFYKQDLSECNHPFMVDIELSNTCDAKCVYCIRLFSSRWADEDLAEGRVTKETLQRELPGSSPDFEKYFWIWFESVLPGLGRVNFIGGEPLFNKHYFEYVQRLNDLFDKVGKKPQTLQFSTLSNFNSPDFVLDRFIKILPELTRRYYVNLDVSMEATGAQAEYIREGVRWEQWKKNVRKILGLRIENFELGIQSAINVLSLAGLPEFFKTIQELRDEFGSRIVLKTNIVNWPYHLSPYIATPDLIQPLIDAADFIKSHHRPELDSPLAGHAGFNWNRYPQFLYSLADSLLKPNDGAKERANFYKWVIENDRVRKRDFLATFPQYQFFYDECSKEYKKNEGSQANGISAT